MRTSGAKGQARTCPVCRREVRPPALHFDRVECVREYIAKARKKEPLFPEAKR